jgi:hypothetical protein
MTTKVKMTALQIGRFANLPKPAKLLLCLPLMLPELVPERRDLAQLKILLPVKISWINEAGM